MNTNNRINCQLGAIFGTGRSGTTWLGSIVSSHPEISYRFEPFHRLQNAQAEISQAVDLIRSDTFSPKDLSQIYHCLSPAYPECEKPPFFAKKFPIRAGRKFTWPLSRNNSLGAYVFKRLYTPKEQPMLIFKEVDLVDILIRLIIQGGIPIVYIVRHPCAVVSSIIRGQKNSLMPSARRSVLGSLLAKHEPTLAKKYQPRLNSLKVCEQEALLWLIDVGRALRACKNSAKGLVVIYEQLTQQPLVTSTKVFQHLGLDMTPESAAFIEESTNNSSSSRIKRGEVGINSYFTVFRDPKIARDRWKKEMSQEDRTRVMEIVQDSIAFSFGAERGLWV
ncbi:sulfotransferase domain-containing protein [Pleurocapsales cyanobacterium LEGE 10410]|nr:sulfotransferase domain-containing protein [Pleurocapsales cyanobacterium LEGE 10410]